MVEIPDLRTMSQWFEYQNKSQKWYPNLIRTRDLAKPHWQWAPWASMGKGGNRCHRRNYVCFQGFRWVEGSLLSFSSLPLFPGDWIHKVVFLRKGQLIGTKTLFISSASFPIPYLLGKRVTVTQSLYTYTQHRNLQILIWHDDSHWLSSRRTCRASLP